MRHDNLPPTIATILNTLVPGPKAVQCLLYEHEDGRYAVAASPETATFAHGDPKWHRIGPVEVFGVNQYEQEGER